MYVVLIKIYCPGREPYWLNPWGLSRYFIKKEKYVWMKSSGPCHQTEELVRLSKPKPQEISELRMVGVGPSSCLTVSGIEHINIASHCEAEWFINSILPGCCRSPPGIFAGQISESD